MKKEKRNSKIWYFNAEKKKIIQGASGDIAYETSRPGFSQGRIG
jgi:hypothetical protein